MKSRYLLLLISILLLCWFRATAQAPDKTGSPYFVVAGEEGTLPLVHTGADVHITGVIANVSVTQRYHNSGKKPIEAVYTFPMSTRAAVHALTFRVGKRVVKAVVKEKNQATAEYDSARAAGRNAVLLTQDQPNVMQMRLSNIMPGDSIEVVLQYTELLIPENGEYEFVYPTVVGPRYSNGSATGIASDAAASPATFPSLPYTHSGTPPAYTFGMRVRLSTGIPATYIQSPSHELKVMDKGAAQYEVETIYPGTGDRDFILRYSLRGNEIQTGVVKWESDDENFFLLMAQPPARIPMDICPKREYFFILDVSGSMYGFPLAISKGIITSLLDSLGQGDFFNIMTFAGDDRIFENESVQATPGNKKRALDFVNQTAAGGGTEMQLAVKKALLFPRKPGTSRNFVILTDGFVNFDRSMLELVAQQLGDANFYTFGIGSSVNRYLIEGMAAIGKGLPLVATSETEGREKAERFLEYMGNPVLTGIRVDMGGNQVYDLEPQAQPDLLADRPVVMIGKYKGSLQGEAVITGFNANGDWENRLDLSAPASAANDALPYLWARERIRRMDDFSEYQNDNIFRDEVTQLGLRYNLLTRYTAFIGVMDEVRNPGGEQETSNQALPLPSLVPDGAVDGTDNYQMGLVTISGVSTCSSVCVVDACSYTVIKSCDRSFTSSLEYRYFSGFAQSGPAAHYLGMPLFTGPAAGFSSPDYGITSAYWNTAYQGLGSAHDAQPGVLDISPSTTADHKAELFISSNQLGATRGGIHFYTDPKNRWSGRTGINGSFTRSDIDRNTDGFSDIPGLSDLIFTSDWKAGSKTIGGNWNHMADVGIFLMDRRERWKTTPQFRDIYSPAYPYGADLGRQQAGLYTRQQFYTASDKITLSAFGSHLLNQSTYDIQRPRNYQGTENRLWVTAEYLRFLKHDYELRAGLSYDHDHFDQVWQDTVVTRHEHIPGVYAGLKKYFSSGTALEAGARTDYHNLYGWIITPQASGKLRLFPKSDFSIGGSIMRYTEPANPMITWSNLLLTNRRVDAPILTRPEQAYVLGANISLPLRGSSISLEYTNYIYTNRVLPDLDSDPNRIQWISTSQTSRQILRARSQVRLTTHLWWNASAEWQSDLTPLGGSNQWNYFAPRWNVNTYLDWDHTFKAKGHRVSVTPGVTITGPQRLPYSLGSPTRFTSPFANLYLYTEYEISRWTFSLSGRNLLGIMQPNATIGSVNVLPDATFEGGWRYGLVAGRIITAGLKVNLGKKQ